MTRELSILFIDDSEEDVDLTRAEIERSGYEVKGSRVQTADGVRKELTRHVYDCIICDHKMPGFTSLAALKVVREIGVDTPFLIVSGVIGEETAVDAMRAGAHDYIKKNNLLRLVPAIERELREAKVRRESRRSLELLKESERRFRSLADTVPVFIWTADATLKTTYLNRRWKEVLNIDAENPRQIDWTRYIHPGDLETVLAAARDAFSQGKEYLAEYRLKGPGGEWLNVRGSASPRFNESGELEEYIGSVVDLTDLVRARTAAESANRAKSAFLANMSHEIRTPLGAILGFADLLRDEEIDSAERRYYLDIIVRNGTELLRIIGDILDLSKIEAGKIALEISLFRVRELIEEVATLLEMKAEEKNIKLKIGIDPSVPDWMESDRTRFKQILVNMVGNAIKFTNEGEVRLWVDICADALRGQMVRVAVEDTGTGISFEKQARLFQPFSQGDTSTTRVFGGTGLGLVLSRHMARALHGEVVLERSRPGQGSKFVVAVAANYRGEKMEVQMPDEPERFSHDMTLS